VHAVAGGLRVPGRHPIACVRHHGERGNVPGRLAMSDGIVSGRLQHLVLMGVRRGFGVRFYCDLLASEVTKQYPNAAFLKIPSSPTTTTLGLF